MSYIVRVNIYAERKVFIPVTLARRPPMAWHTVDAVLPDGWKLLADTWTDANTFKVQLPHGPTVDGFYETRYEDSMHVPYVRVFAPFDWARNVLELEMSAYVEKWLVKDNEPAPKGRERSGTSEVTRRG